MIDPPEDQPDLEPDSESTVITETSAPAEPRFPWPPGADENVFHAAAETIRQSLFTPSSFFRAMPPQPIGSALAYAIPISVIGGTFTLFWTSIFDLAGILPALDPWFYTESEPVTRLLEFLFSPLLTVIVLFVGASITHLMLKILGAAKYPLSATVRVAAFCSSTSLFTIVPLIGMWIATVWAVVLYVIGLREAHRTTTGRAIAAIFIPAFVLALMFAALFVLFAIGLLAAGAQL